MYSRKGVKALNVSFNVKAKRTFVQHNLFIVEYVMHCNHHILLWKSMNIKGTGIEKCLTLDCKWLHLPLSAQ